MWIFQINLQSTLDDVKHFIFHVEWGTGLVLHSSSLSLGFCFDTVSSPKSLGLVLVTVHPGLGLDLVLGKVVLTTDGKKARKPNKNGLRLFTSLKLSIYVETEKCFLVILYFNSYKSL